MEYGNWTPISKAFVKHLPKDRPFSKPEAGFALQVALDQRQEVTVSGLAARWNWSRKKVNNLFGKTWGSYRLQKKYQEIPKSKGTDQYTDRARKGSRSGADKID